MACKGAASVEGLLLSVTNRMERRFTEDGGLEVSEEGLKWVKVETTIGVKDRRVKELTNCYKYCILSIRLSTVFVCIDVAKWGLLSRAHKVYLLTYILISNNRKQRNQMKVHTTAYTL